MSESRELDVQSQLDILLIAKKPYAAPDTRKADNPRSRTLRSVSWIGYLPNIAIAFLAVSAMASASFDYPRYMLQHLGRELLHDDSGLYQILSSQFRLG